MKFEYQFFEGKYLPIIPIGLRGKNGTVIELRAFIDTGASYCIFRSDVADLLSIELESGEKREMTLGDGNAIIVFVHKLPVLIAEKEFIAPIAFSKEIGVNLDIIGREGIFKQFIICFDEQEKVITFTSKN